MSGLEVAGVVLGAIPIIIAAVENYESGLDRVQAFWKWQDYLECAIRELWVQHSSFEMTLRNLLKEVASPAEAQKMMQDFDNPLWSAAALSESFEEKLGAAFGVYVHTIREIESCMLKLASHLDIDRKTGTSGELEAIILANRPTDTPRGPLRFEFKRRVKLTMKKREIRRLLEVIQRCNQRLDEFIAKADKLEQPSSQPTGWKSSLSLSLEEIQEYATSLHHALSRAWSCSAQAPHQVYLLLEHRMVRRKRQRSLRPAANPDDTANFTISLKSPAAFGHQHTVEVKIMEYIQPFKKTQIKTPVVHVEDITAPLLTGEMESLKSLCPLLCTQPDPLPSQCFRLDSCGRLYRTHETCPGPPCQVGDLVTLDELLARPSEMRRRRPLNDEQRYLLAVTLASSLIQLHATPWLGDSWCKQHILFPEIRKGDVTAIDVKHPLVLRSYGCDEGHIAVEGNDHFTQLMQDSANLLTLAKILLEIKLNDRFEGQRVGGSDVGAAAKTADIQTLMRWMTEEKGNLSCPYRDVVSHCIKCSVDPNISLRNVVFRQDLVDKVVVPLLEEFHHWKGE